MFLRCSSDCVPRFVSSTQGPDQCDTCLHVRDGPYCVAECPSSKYAQANGTCSPCHEHCAEGAGCTGPLDEVGPEACNACAVVRFDDADRSGGPPVARCLPADVDCGDGFYRGQVPPDMRTPGIGKQVRYSSCRSVSEIMASNALGSHTSSIERACRYYSTVRKKTLCGRK